MKGWIKLKGPYWMDNNKRIRVLSKHFHEFKYITFIGNNGKVLEKELNDIYLKKVKAFKK